MKLDSKYFDSIRVKRGPAGAKPPEVPLCQWQGCAEPGLHRAPQGRGREGNYFRFCTAHVQQYNKSYNYFEGMSDSEVEAFQKSSATGHRPTWTIGANSWAHGREADPHHHRFVDGGRGGAKPHDPFNLFGAGGARAGKARRADNPAIGNMARKSLRALNLDDHASKPEIKTRFKELVKRHHPDANGGDRSSEDRLREIIVAYNYLKSAGLC
jgi:curved DNA-binding protein CbpA